MLTMCATNGAKLKCSYFEQMTIRCYFLTDPFYLGRCSYGRCRKLASRLTQRIAIYHFLFEQRW
uniref:Uncharacterized protein n=1 Tax=Romanomermis culicivorax TaxID=13658 RepID=A0A915K4R8_ROMCU